MIWTALNIKTIVAMVTASVIAALGVYVTEQHANQPAPQASVRVIVVGAEPTEPPYQATAADLRAQNRMKMMAQPNKKLPW